MKINADFTRRAAEHTADMDWIPSPMVGVERKMLDRFGAEVARATSIVRYAPGSAFSTHVHGGGEEILVLEGIFEDEYGAYPAGSYLRNPAGTRHTPGSARGCTILVKLWQFAEGDHVQLALSPDEITLRAMASLPGMAAATLFANANETVRLGHWQAGTEIRLPPMGGFELLCLEGSFREGGEAFNRWSWLRLPREAALDAVAGPEGCRLWIKTGHLAAAERFCTETFDLA